LAAKRLTSLSARTPLVSWADLALLEHVGGPIPHTGLGAGVRNPFEAEGVLVPVGRLLGVADPQFEVVPPVEGHEVAL
jgi:hypothetical protein